MLQQLDYASFREDTNVEQEYLLSSSEVTTPGCRKALRITPIEVYFGDLMGA
jgi:hypothetical protein